MEASAESCLSLFFLSHPDPKQHPVADWGYLSGVVRYGEGGTSAGLLESESVEASAESDVRIYVSIYVYIVIYVYMYICIYVDIHMYMYTYISTYVYIYIHIYRNTHIQTLTNTHKVNPNPWQDTVEHVPQRGCSRGRGWRRAPRGFVREGEGHGGVVDEGKGGITSAGLLERERVEASAES